MRLLAASLGSALFLLVVPGTVAGWVPWWLAGGRIGRPLLGWAFLQPAGAALAVAGAIALLHCFGAFVVRGRGTPAPIAPTERLVVSGLYRHVRNPMYVAVVSVIVGQALLLGSARVLLYAAAVALAFSLFVVLYEEPALRRQFGHAYDEYRAAVPRCVPRLSPWRG